MYIILLTPHNSQTNAIIIPIWQNRKWKPREFKYLVSQNRVKNPHFSNTDEITPDSGPATSKGKAMTWPGEKEQGYEETLNHV